MLIATPRLRREVFWNLHYKKRFGGRGLVADVPDLKLLKNDRLEPSAHKIDPSLKLEICFFVFCIVKADCCVWSGGVAPMQGCNNNETLNTHV